MHCRRPLPRGSRSSTGSGRTSSPPRAHQACSPIPRLDPTCCRRSNAPWRPSAAPATTRRRACSPVAGCSTMRRTSTFRPPSLSARRIASRRRPAPVGCSMSCRNRRRSQSIARLAKPGMRSARSSPSRLRVPSLRSSRTRRMPMPDKAKRRRASAGGPYIAPPVQRAVRLIRHVAEGNPVLNMSETAKALKINRTTLLRLLHTLEAEGFVERRPNGAGFQVGLSLLEVGARALFSQDLVQVAVPVLTELAETLQLSAHLGVLDGTDVLYLVRRTPNTPLASNIRVGSRLPAHATTMGRMLLAFLPPVEVERLYAGKELQRFSEHTSTTLAALRTKAEKDRAAGIAWSEAHFERGIGSAAVPVFDFAGAPVGAVNVSGPVAAFAQEERRAVIGTRLRTAGTEISRRLGWVGEDRGKPSTKGALIGAAE